MAQPSGGSFSAANEVAITRRTPGVLSNKKEANASPVN
jgi:hypothetical protein